MLTGKKIFVTGASGFVGSHLVKRLLKLNAEVHCLKRSKSSNKRLEILNNKLFFHDIDITNYTHLESTVKKINPTAIFHLANQGLYKGYESNTKSVVSVNLLGTINLLEATKSLPYELFVNTGSSSEYGPKIIEMKESDVCFPHGVYATTKLAGTVYASSFAKQFHKPIVTLRLFTPFGPNDDPRRLIPSVIKLALKNEPISIGGRDPVRDFIYIDDVIDMYIHSLKSKNQFTGDIINVGSGKQHSVGNVVDAILKLSKSKSRVVINQAIKRIESPVWQADITRRNMYFPNKSYMTLLQGLKKTIAWYKEENLV